MQTLTYQIEEKENSQYKKKPHQYRAHAAVSTGITVPIFRKKYIGITVRAPVFELVICGLACSPLYHPRHGQHKADMRRFNLSASAALKNDFRPLKYSSQVRLSRYIHLRSAICIVKQETYQYPSKIIQMGLKLHLDLDYEKKSLTFLASRAPGARHVDE